MKLFRLVLALALVAMAVSFTSTPSKAGQFTYQSGIQVQNLENTQATITVRFFDQAGTEVATATDPVAALGSKTYFGTTMPSGVPNGFNGSVVITSNTQVAAVSNVHGNVGGNALGANASYVAANQGSTNVLLPLLMKGNSGYNTWYNLQNTGTADATVNVTYSDGSTAGPVTIPANASKTFDQTTETHTAKVFSASVNSNQPLAATVVEESASIMFAYSGLPAGSKNPVLPLINSNNVGYRTGVQIQNAGATDTDVTVTYTPSGAANTGTQCTETQTVKAGQSNTFAWVAFELGNNPALGGTTTCTPQARFVGSARVTGNTANTDLTVIVNQVKGSTNGEAYSGFDPNALTSKVVFPLIMDRNSGYWTGFNLMNAGSTAVPVTCSYTNSSVTNSATLQPGQALNALQLNNLADKYVGSGTCVSTDTSAQLVGVVNELGPSATLDQLLVYEGINVAP